MSENHSDLSRSPARASVSQPTTTNALLKHKNYLIVLTVFALMHFSDLTSPPPAHLWFLGAISVSLSYSFGFRGLTTALILTLLVQQFLGHPQGITGTLAGLLFTASISISVLLPYYRSDGDSIKHSLLINSSETGVFIVLAAFASLLSTGLYILSLNIGNNVQTYSLADYGSFSLASMIALVCSCPLLVIWRRKNYWAHLPSDPKEYTAWCFALIFTAFLSNAFGREWLVIVSFLLIWAVTRFNWFGTCLALAITTLFVSPKMRQTPISGESNEFINWALQNMELILWLALSSALLYFASLLADKRRIEKDLENRVEQRTELLNEANNNLKRQIDTRHAAEAALKKTNKRYRALIETAGIPVIVLNENLLIEHWNSACEATSGYRYENVLGKDFLSLCIPKDQHESLIWRLKKAEASSTNQENVETSLVTSCKKVVSMLWNINFIADEDLDEHGQFLLIGQDISNIRETQNQLHYLAHFDSLTGAANRRLFEDRCRQSIETAKRYNTKLALISIDIDHFKTINDSLGHDGGDEFLVELVKRCQSSVRKEDTIARIGGDEFAILLPNVSGQDGAEVVARNILENLTRPINIKGNELVITSSVGITLCPDDGDRYEELLRNSDMALYRAKSAGRNNIQFFCADMNNEMVRQKRIKNELREALSEGQLQLHYQPIIDTKTGEIVALEALTRWNHPKRGIVFPEFFLSVAEQTGLIQEIGAWAINQLCLESEELNKHYYQELPIAFNLTRKQYQHPLLLKMLSDALEAHRFNPQKLIIELSEDTVTQANGDSIAVVKQLKSLGCVIAIDSFGKGQSSLSQLNALPIDIIKIDRSFVVSCISNRRDRMIVEAVLAMSKQLNLKSFAAGVETAKQEAFLQKNGCHYVQGFLYSEALPLKELAEFLSTSDVRNGLHSGDQITLPFSQELF